MTWAAQAACTRPDANPDDWFPGAGSRPDAPGKTTQAALAACHGCPIRVACRDDMLARVRSGLLPSATIWAGWWWPQDRGDRVRPHRDDRDLYATLARSGS